MLQCIHKWFQLRFFSGFICLILTAFCAPDISFALTGEVIPLSIRRGYERTSGKSWEDATEEEREAYFTFDKEERKKKERAQKRIERAKLRSVKAKERAEKSAYKSKTREVKAKARTAKNKKKAKEKKKKKLKDKMKKVKKKMKKLRKKRR